MEPDLESAKVFLPSYLTEADAGKLLTEIRRFPDNLQGNHGPELRLKGEPKDTEIVHVIIGNGDNPMEEPNTDTATVFTWYPGRLTAKVDLPETLEGFDLRTIPNATVKLVGGAS